MAKKQLSSLKLQAVELRAGGKTYKEIAEELGTDIQQAIDMASDESDKIATLRAVKMEALFQEERINQTGRIERLSALQARLKEELDRRDLSDIPTDKLITLYLKTSETIKGEVYTPKILSSTEQAKAQRERSMFEW